MLFVLPPLGLGDFECEVKAQCAESEALRENNGFYLETPDILTGF